MTHENLSRHTNIERTNSRRVIYALLLFSILSLVLTTTEGSNVNNITSNSSLPPQTSLLQSGTSDLGAIEFCGEMGFAQSIRTSPSSFICGDLTQLETQAPQQVIPEQKPESGTISYVVREGDTLSQIIEQQLQTTDVYGGNFRNAVTRNAGWLTQKSSTAKAAIEKLLGHPEWTPRTSHEAWETFMQATHIINPGDIIALE